MVFFRERTRELSGRLVITFCLALISFSALEAQVVDPPITVEISQDKILVDQRFDLTIFADFPLYRRVSIKEPALPDGIQLAGGPYKSAQTVRVGDLENPQYIKKTRVFYKYKVSKPGIYTIGSFTLSDGDTTLTTDPFTFSVLAFDERNLSYPIFARWSQIPHELYVGETIPLILKMENLEALSFPDSVIMTPPSGGLFEQVTSIGEIEVSTILDDEVYIAPIDSWLFTPTSSGRVIIPKATVQMGEIKRTTTSKTVTVMDIPEEFGMSGAVGTFEVFTELENLPFNQNDMATLRIRVEGEGNLSYLQMPVPEFEGLNLVGKEEINRYSPSLSGYSGYREDLYRLSPGEGEEIKIRFSQWNWYDRNGNGLKEADLTAYSFKNENPVSPTEEPTYREDFSLLDSEAIINERQSFYDKTFYYLLVLPGIISLIAAIIRKRYDRRLSAFALLILLISASSVSLPPFADELDKAMARYEEGDYAGALIVYELLSSDFEENSAFQYNKGLIHFDMDQRGEAVFHMRKALNGKPGSSLFTNALKMVEGQYELDHQFHASSGLSPDLFFLLFILLFNGGLFIISYNLRRKRMELSILIIMVFFLSVVSLSIVFYSYYVAQSETAVVSSSGGQLKKVPGQLGGEWLELAEGTALQVLSRSDDYVLIRTGYGLEGWLGKDELFILNEEEL